MERTLVLPISTQPSVNTQLEYAERADELGYDRVWLAETWGRDAVSLLASIASRTDDVGIGTSISSVYSRSPALLGQTAATLAELSDGRFRMGLGPSGRLLNEMWHGIAHDRPLRRLRESIEIVRQVLSGEVVDYDGDIFQLSGFRLRFDPPTPPPRVDAAALGPKAMELAGRFADGVHTWMTTRDQVSDRLTHFDRGCELADRPREDRSVMVGVPACALSDGGRARDRVRHTLAFYVGAMGEAYRDQLARQGYDEEAAEIARLWMEGRKDEAEATMSDRMVSELGIAGTPSAARAALAEWESLESIDSVALLLPMHTPIEETMATIEALAP